MQELRQFFNAIILSLKKCGVSKDIRRVILSQCIFDEFQSRHSSNCVGPGYTALSLMMLKPKFAQLYIGRKATDITLKEEERRVAFGRTITVESSLGKIGNS